MKIFLQGPVDRDSILHASYRLIGCHPKKGKKRKIIG
jgi:hypothetical protein